MIREGRVLLLAGTEEDLAALPPGCWIGGTAGYFVTPRGSVAAGRQIFFTDFTSVARGAHWRMFDAADIHHLSRDYPANGFAMLILPGFSRLLSNVAARIMEFDGLYNLPLMGWVSAVPLDALARMKPKIFAGGQPGAHEAAAVLYIAIAGNQSAQLHIANLFSPGTGPDIRFLTPGMRLNQDCLIGGLPRNLAQYIEAEGIDRRLPLVADHDGALFNAALLSTDAQTGEVIFLAPVSPALTYRFAEAVEDYETEFSHAAAEIELEFAAHVCICALHYRYAGFTPQAALAHNIAGLPPPGRPQRQMLDITAPVTFGQIAYTVLNQTLTCLAITQLDDLTEAFYPDPRDRL